MKEKRAEEYVNRKVGLGGFSSGETKTIRADEYEREVFIAGYDAATRDLLKLLRSKEAANDERVTYAATCTPATPYDWSLWLQKKLDERTGRAE